MRRQNSYPTSCLWIQFIHFKYGSVLILNLADLLPFFRKNRLNYPYHKTIGTMNTYLSSVVKQFHYYKMLGEKAIAQLDEDQLFQQCNEESNSIAILVNHIAGNMLSRFTEFLTSDGEKPWRNRDAEFTNPFPGKGDMMKRWEEGWTCLFHALEQISEEDLERIVYIRHDGHTVIEALNRQLAHYAYHIGQMVFLAKMFKDKDWKTLSIARNQSSEHNQRKFSNEKGRRHYTDDL